MEKHSTVFLRQSVKVIVALLGNCSREQPDSSGWPLSMENKCHASVVTSLTYPTSTDQEKQSKNNERKRGSFQWDGAAGLSLIKPCFRSASVVVVLLQGGATDLAQVILIFGCGKPVCLLFSLHL